MAGETLTQREVTRRQVLAGAGGAVAGLVVGGFAGNALAPKSSTTSSSTSKGTLKVVGIYPTLVGSGVISLACIAVVIAQPSIWAIRNEALEPAAA